MRWLVAAAALLAPGCRRLADAEVRPPLPSPDGAHAARLYELSGGLGGGFRDALVDVRRRDAAFDPYGDAYAFGVTSAAGVTLAWDGPARLTIRYPAGADVFRRCARAGGVAIAYVVGPDSASRRAVPRGDLTRGCERSRAG
jgi:hypothetical protein